MKRNVCYSCAWAKAYSNVEHSGIALTSRANVFQFSSRFRGTFRLQFLKGL